MKGEELAAVVLSGSVVVTAAVLGTLYANDSDMFSDPLSEEIVSDNGQRRFDLEDAYYSCRDRIPMAIPYKVHNVLIDHQSSRYLDKKNQHQVFISLEVQEKPGVYRSNKLYPAQINCMVSASSNEVQAFNIKKI